MSKLQRNFIMGCGLGLLCLAGLSLGAGVELHPGLLRGTIVLTDKDTGDDEVVSSHYVYAWTPADVYEGRASGTGAAYRLTLEGDNEYKHYVRATLSNSSGTTYLTMRREQPIYVPLLEGTNTDGVASDFIYNTVRIAATVNVTGAEIASIQLSASASEGQETYQAYRSLSASGTTSTTTFPMVVDSEVRVSGNATLQYPNGATLRVSLSAKDITLAGGGASVTWDLAPSEATVSGTINLPAAVDDIFNRHVVSAGNSNQSVTKTSHGPYTLGAGAGFQWLRAVTYFDAPYGYIEKREYLTIAAGSSITRDYVVSGMGTLHGSVVPKGFVTPGQVSSMTGYFRGLRDTPTAGYRAIDSSGDGTWDVALPVGTWRQYYKQLRIWDNSNPSSRLNATITEYPYSGAQWDIADGSVQVTDPEEILFAETALVFDVAEPAGVSDEYLIRNPRVTLTRDYESPDGTQRGRERVEAFGSGDLGTTATLRFVGRDERYELSAYATVQDSTGASSNVSFGRFPHALTVKAAELCSSGACAKLDFEVQDLLRPEDSDNSPPPLDVNVTFEGGVSTAGYTSVSLSPIGPEAPPNFRIVAQPIINDEIVDYVPAYYYISTTAEFTPMVKVCLSYRDSWFDDCEGTGTNTCEEDTVIGHYRTDTAEWEILDDPGDPNYLERFPETNIICAETDSFSPFALLLPNNAAPVADAGSDQILECLLPGQSVPVALDGSGSSDPDGDALTYRWSTGGVELATGVAPTVSLPAGSHSVALEVSDGLATSEPDQVLISLLEDTEPPQISLVGDPAVVLECGSTYVDPGATATDSCSGDLTDAITISGGVDAMTPGIYGMYYQVADSAGLTDTTARVVLVQDTVAPAVTVAEPISMWPPNHTYASFRLSDCASIATDWCEPGLDIDTAGRIVAITSDEPDDARGGGDGHTTSDVVVQGPSSFLLRQERQGAGNGRVYSVQFVITDGHGNTSAPATCTFHVTHSDPATCAAAIDDGAAYTVSP